MTPVTEGGLSGEERGMLTPEQIEAAVLEVWTALTKRKSNRPAHALPVQIYPDPKGGVAVALRPIIHRIAQAAAEAQREADAKVAEEHRPGEDRGHWETVGADIAAAIRASGAALEPRKAKGGAK